MDYWYGPQYEGYTVSVIPKMLSAKQPGDPVFKGDEQIVMANPVWLFVPSS